MSPRKSIKITIVNRIKRIRCFLLGDWSFHEESENDLLGHETYSQNITEEVLKNLDETATRGKYDSYIFAISGKWGVGKTGLLERVEPKLKKKSIPVFWFRPWQYSESTETLRRAFLNDLHISLNSFRNVVDKTRFWLSNSGFLDRLQYEESRTLIRFSVFLPCFLVIVVLCILHFDYIAYFQIDVWKFYIEFPGLLYKFVMGYPIVVSLLTLLLGAPLLSQLLKVQRSQTRISSVDEFESLFDKTIGRFKKVVVFVDDLDRCTPEGVKLVLDSLKTFFKSPKVAYLITGDHTVIERHIGKQLNVKSVYRKDKPDEIDKKETEQEEELEGRRFLKKLFNVYWRVPPIDTIYMRSLVETNLENMGQLEPPQKEQVQTLMVNFLDRNPREVVRFVDLLMFSRKTVELRLEALSQTGGNIENLKKNLEEVRNRPDLLVKVLLIQEKFDAAFKEYSLQPARYATLEREQLQNLEAGESQLMRDKLTNYVNLFFSLVKSNPTFHNAGASVLERSPENFFYHSGFAEASDRGIVSENFLARYITADADLIKDIQGTSVGRVIEIIPSAIQNLNQLKDSPTIGQAVSNLLNIILSYESIPELIVINLIDNPTVKNYFKSLPNDQQKDDYVKQLQSVALKYESVKILKKLLAEDPWMLRKETIWSSVNAGNASDEVLEVLVNDVINDSTGGIDITQRKQKILNDHWDILTDNASTIDKIKLTTSRLNNLADQLSLKDVVDNKLFSRIIESIKASHEALKNEELTSFLDKGNAMWSKLQRPANELKALNSNSTLRKLSPGDKVRKSYESWYPPSVKKINKLRKRRSES